MASKWRPYLYLVMEAKMRTKNPLQSQSEIIMRDIVMGVLILFFLVFIIIPLGIALVGSFHKWNPLIGQFSYVGSDNYVRLIQDELFWKSLLNTFIFSVVVIFFRLLIGLALAYAIFSKFIKFKNFFRTLYFIPVVTPLIAVAFVWRFMYNPQFGLFAQLFGSDLNWLKDTRAALPAIEIMTVWKDTGYAVVLFYAALCGLPQDVLDAVSIDGASSWQKFRYVTFPLLKPMTLFVVITSIISYLQAYIQVMVLTEGGPGTATYLSSYMIFNEAFVKYHFGYASSMSFILFIIIAVLTYLSFKVSADKEEVV